MEWIYHFSNYKIPFYIYKINKGESIAHTLQSYNSRCIIILNGVVYLMKIFNNEEIIGLGIFHEKDIITIKEDQKNLYCNCAITALRTTFLMIFELEDIVDRFYTKTDLLKTIILSYDRTFYKYEMMNTILSHKSCRNRLIQLILCLCEEFGVIEKNSIIIPFSIPQTTLSIIVGCNTGTINKLFHDLYRDYAITHTYQKYICIKDPFFLSSFYNNNVKNKT